jgi:signal transduction histidine kinase
METVVESESRDACYVHLRDVHTDGNKRTAQLECLRGTDGSFWAHLETRPFSDGDGQVEGFRVAVVDISDRLQAEQRLRQLSKELEQRVAERTKELAEKSRQLRKMVVELSTIEDRQRRQLADLLHDDLQQVLVGVRFHLGRVTQQWSEDPPEALETADRLLGEAIGKTRRLSHQLDPPALREEGLEEGIRWLVDSIQQNQPLNVEIRSDGELDDVCEPITRLVYKAVRELLLNVVKHAGVDRASLELKRLDGHLQVRISDDGAGFECAGDSGQAMPGLGLATIRERAQALGGDLEIDSRPREGTRVTLRVPIRDPRVDEAREEVQAATKTEEGPRCDPGAKKIRIAIVDDHRVVREGLASLLTEQPDLEVVGEASTGVEAMDVIDEHRPDVVLMDFSMPEMSGEEATRRISRRWPGVRVVALSMFEEGFASQKMIEAGAEAYVPKAGHTDKLINIIRNGYGAK